MARVRIWKRVCPVWGNEDDEGNGMLPKGDQWSFEAKIRPTLEEIQGVERMVNIANDEGSTDEDVARDMRGLFLQLARNPQNLYLQDDAGEFVEIRAIEDMLPALDPSLFNELMLIILEQRTRASGEGSGQSFGGDTTTQPEETAPLASSEAG